MREWERDRAREKIQFESSKDGLVREIFSPTKEEKKKKSENESSTKKSQIWFSAFKDYLMNGAGEKTPAYLSIDYESSLILLTNWKLTKIDKYGQSTTILSAWVEIATKFVERSPRA